MNQKWRKQYKFIRLFITIRNSLIQYIKYSFLCWGFLDNLEHLLLDEFFFENQSIFVPHEVRLFRVDVIFLHAAFKKPDDVTIIWVLREAETSAVVHEFLELLWLVLAQLLNLDLLLLFLDIGILLSF